MALPVNHPIGDSCITAFSPSVGTTPLPAYIVPPYRCQILKVGGTLQGAITGADAIVTTAINTVAITNGVITMTNAGSAAGSTFSALPSAANIANEGDIVSFTATAATGTTIGCNFYAVIRKTA